MNDCTPTQGTPLGVMVVIDGHGSGSYRLENAEPGPAQVCIHDPTHSVGFQLPVQITGEAGTAALSLGAETSPVAEGRDHALSVGADGTVFAAGMNTYGQLGDRTTIDNPDGGIIPGLANIDSVAAGEGHSLALQDDGTVWAWGTNQLGELGDLDIGEDKTSPVPTIFATGMSSVAAGCHHSLALGSDGSVWAWGDNSSGQLGIDTTWPHSQVRVHVQGLGSVKAIAAGCAYSMALDVSGTMWTWGDNSVGQLGDGTTTSRFFPRPVSSLGTGAVAIAAGRQHALAVLGDGRVQAWGDDSSGQLGDGFPEVVLSPSATSRTSSGSASSPVLVSDLTDVGTVAAGGNHSVAVTKAGAVWAWGANDRHQLGNNTTVPSDVPMQVLRADTGLPLTGMSTTLAAGGDHSVVVSGDMRIMGWGALPAQGIDAATGTEKPGPSTRTKRRSSRPRPVPPNPLCGTQIKTPSPTYLPPDSLGRPTGAQRTLNSTSLRVGERVDVPDRLKPPGWVAGLDKAHLTRTFQQGPSPKASSP